MSKLDELKKINEQKKELAAKQKELREELDANKEQRKAARKVQAQCRKDVQGDKAEVRDLSAKVYEVFSTGDAEAVDALADSIMEAATKLSATVRAFAQAQKEYDADESDELDELGEADESEIDPATDEDIDEDL